DARKTRWFLFPEVWLCKKLSAKRHDCHHWHVEVFRPRGRPAAGGDRCQRHAGSQTELEALAADIVTAGGNAKVI
ncbi:hypothetical protein, partial [Escherichia coli]|uniref:hypothetical protein n=1 Tax=Escherichia coli TaxID=562 RepID=UPI001BDC5C0B